MAISGEPIAVEVLRVRAQEVADALLAHASNGVTPESGLAVLAVSALRVEEAFETVAGVGVTVGGVVVVPVVTTVAWDARAAGDFRISVIVIRAYGTAESYKNYWMVMVTLSSLTRLKQNRNERKKNEGMQKCKKYSESFSLS